MMKRNLFILFTLLFTVFIVVGCSNKENNGEVQNNESVLREKTENTEGSTEKPIGENTINAETNAENDSTNEVASKNVNKDLPNTIEMNEEIITDTGLIFMLEKITFEDDHIAVNFHAENNSGFIKYLATDGVAYDEDLGGITFIDDTGFAYRYVADSGDSMIGIKNQETIDATVRFLGKVRDDAKTLTLIFNPNHDDSTDSPKLEFKDIEIPW